LLFVFLGYIVIILIQICVGSISWKLLNVPNTIPAVVKCVFSVHKFEQTADY